MPKSDQIRSFLTKTVITQPKMVQIPKFWCLNPSTIICPSCENIHSVRRTITNELTAVETFKTFNFKPHFPIKKQKMWNISQGAPGTDYINPIF